MGCHGGSRGCGTACVGDGRVSGDKRRGGLPGTSARLEVGLQQVLGRQHVAATLPLAGLQPRFAQLFVGEAGREAFVMEADRELADLGQPGTKLAGFPRFLPLVPREVHRQTNHNSDRPVLGDLPAEEAGILRDVGPLAIADGRSEGLVEI